MTRMQTNMRWVTALFLAMFALLGIYFSYSIYSYGSRWFNSAYNPRIHQAKQEVNAGDVLDRNGTVLATTDVQGERVYAKDKATRLAVAHVVGDDTAILSTGVETFHAGELLGFQQGLVYRVEQMVTSQARKGSDLTLTIDAQLQTYIASIFPKGKDGAVALLNYKTGELYALYSSPSFDVNQIGSIEGGSALINRATQGQYAPGSIFKVITLASGLRQDPQIATKTFFCEGIRQIDEFSLTDNQTKGHGELTLSKAFNVSCNLTFGQIGMDVGQANLRKTAEDFAFNDEFLFRDLMLYSSKFPSGTMGQGKLAWTAVGQGDLLVSPLHMAMIAGAIANNGMMMEPKLVASVSGGRVINATPYKQCISTDMATTLQGYMRDCVVEGTAARASFSGGMVGGKTGTAQTASSTQGILPHSWFIGYNLDDEQPLAIAVIIEQGGSGSENAAPLAGNVMGKASKILWGK